MIIDFFTDIHVPGTKLYIGSADRVFCAINDPAVEVDRIKKIITAHKNENLYFRNAIHKDTPLKRTAAADISHFNRFTLDFDIYNNLKEDFPDLFDNLEEDEIVDYIKNYARHFEEVLGDHELLSDYYMINFTGRGLHVHYLLKEPIFLTEKNRPQLKAGLKVLARQAERKTKERVDAPVAHDISKLVRIPGTFNTKNKRLGEVLYYPRLRMVDFAFVLKLGDIEIENKQKERERKQNTMVTYSNHQTFLDNILATNMQELVIHLHPEWKPAKDGRNFLDKNQKKVGAFVNSNGRMMFFNHHGTPHFPVTCDKQSPFGFIKNYFGFSNSEVYEWFRSYNPNLDPVQYQSTSLI